MLSADEIREAVGSLRRLLAAVEAGEVEATAEELAHVRGAVEAMERVLQAEPLL